MLDLAMLHLRSVLLASVVLPLTLTSACGNDQLTVTGEAAVQMSADRVERFVFDQRIALEEDTRAAALEGVVAGHCVLDQGALTAVDVAVSRPGASSGMTSYRVSAGLVEGGLVTAVVDGIELDGESADASCTVATLYADFDAKTAGVQVDCELTDGTTAYPSSADLHFEECLVR
jgi:hypothetical protein